MKLQYDNFQIIIVDNSETLTSFNKIVSWASMGEQIDTSHHELTTPNIEKPFTDFVSVHEPEFQKLSYKQRIVLVKTDRNNGFSAANNVGLKYLKRLGDYEFAWLLNNDTVVKADTLISLVNCMNDLRSLRVGILGAKVMEYENKEIIQSAGGGRLIRPLAYSYLVGAGQNDVGQFDTSEIEMDFVAGASMFIRKKFLDETGLLSEEYFLYFEEPDWTVRGRRKGWEIGYCFRATIFHKGGASTGGRGYSSGVNKSTVFSDFYFQRAKILFTKNHYMFWLPFVYLSFLLVIFNRLRRGQFDRVKVLVSVLLHPSRKLSR